MHQIVLFCDVLRAPNGALLRATVTELRQDTKYSRIFFPNSKVGDGSCSAARCAAPALRPQAPHRRCRRCARRSGSSRQVSAPNFHQHWESSAWEYLPVTSWEYGLKQHKTHHGF